MQLENETFPYSIPFENGKQLPAHANLLWLVQFMLGDHAFHDCARVVTPYSTSEKSLGDAPTMEDYNSRAHSASRMCAEHGVGFMKKWGVIRGRTDMKLFQAKKHSKA